MKIPWWNDKRETDRERRARIALGKQIMVTASLLLGSQRKAYDVYVLFRKLIYTHLP